MKYTENRSLFVALFITGLLCLSACNPSGSCEHAAGGIQSCVNRSSQRACTPLGGELHADKTCEDLGYTCDEDGNNCHR